MKASGPPQLIRWLLVSDNSQQNMKSVGSETWTRDAVVETDTSCGGWGAAFLEVVIGGRWSITERKLHINTLELEAVLFSVTTFFRDKKIFI